MVLPLIALGAVAVAALAFSSSSRGASGGGAERLGQGDTEVVARRLTFKADGFFTFAERTASGADLALQAGGLIDASARLGNFHYTIVLTKKLRSGEWLEYARVTGGDRSKSYVAAGEWHKAQLVNGDKRIRMIARGLADITRLASASGIKPEVWRLGSNDPTAFGERPQWDDPRWRPVREGTTAA